MTGDKEKEFLKRLLSALKKATKTPARAGQHFFSSRASRIYSVIGIGRKPG